jgi:DNA-binding NarL/FixJ family response regulator
VSASSAMRLEESPAAPGSAPTIRVLIAEGHGLMRAGFRAMLERETDMAVAGEARTGHAAVALAEQTGPDVVLMDIDLPGLDGLRATREILAALDPARVRVLMLMSSDGAGAVFGALRAGASGLLLKDIDRAELLRAIRVVAAGEASLSPSAARLLIDEFVSRPERASAMPEQLDELTEREREVMALVACGLSNEDIAARLVITRATAKTHVSRALLKLHARDRAQLAAIAYQTGLVRPGGERAGRLPVSRPPMTPILRAAA